MSLVTSFSAVYRPDARILILGSMPGIRSLDAAQYYAHPRNHFWPIMAEWAGFSVALPYEERLAQLLAHKVALWDVAQECAREGSLDSNIKSHTVVPNAISELADHCPNLQAILFNGQAAATLFRRHFKQQAVFAMPQHILPSTSPANAAVSFAHKREAWHNILNSLI